MVEQKWSTLYRDDWGKIDPIPDIQGQGIRRRGRNLIEREAGRRDDYYDDDGNSKEICPTIPSSFFPFTLSGTRVVRIPFNDNIPITFPKKEASQEHRRRSVDKQTVLNVEAPIETGLTVKARDCRMAWWWWSEDNNNSISMNSSLPLLPSKVRKVEVKECFPETTESFLSVKEREQNL